MKKIALFLILLCGCSSADDDDVVKWPNYETSKIGTIDGGYNLYTVKINGIDYYATFVNHGVVLGPKVDREWAFGKKKYDND